MAKSADATPVSPGDSIRVVLTAKQITPRETDEYGEVRWDAVLVNQRDEVVASLSQLVVLSLLLHRCLLLQLGK